MANISIKTESGHTITAPTEMWVIALVLRMASVPALRAEFDGVLAMVEDQLTRAKGPALIVPDPASPFRRM